MISIVICSVNPALASQVKQNIEATAGAPVQLIIIDNAVLKKGITAVYNMGAASAIHDIICFVHEDVLFRTQNWAPVLVSIFDRDPQIGLVGVAGSKYKSRTLSGWGTGTKSLDCANVLQRHPEGKGEMNFRFNPDPSLSLQEVVVIDGLFMACRKTVWEEVRHDEELIDGFHVYDIDFSFRVSLQYKVMVTYEIDMIHLSDGGNYGKQWMQYTIRWHRHHRQRLPRSVMNKQLLPQGMEGKVRKSWLHRLRLEKLSAASKIKWIFASGAVWDLIHWPYIGLFLFYRLFNKCKSFF